MGFALPAKYDEWVFHDLSDRGWMVRELLRVEMLGLPLAILCVVFLPGELVLRLTTAFFFVVGPPFVTSFYVTEWRNYRLRQHELLPPGHPYTQRFPEGR